MGRQPSNERTHPFHSQWWQRRSFIGAFVAMGMGALAGCSSLEANMPTETPKPESQPTDQPQEFVKSHMPLTTEYGDTDHLYELPDDPLAAPIPEPPKEPRSVGQMNLYFAQMQFLQNVYLREMAYALREGGQLDGIPEPPWVTDNIRK